MIYDIELDAISKDVFYLGYQGAKYFTTRVVNEDQYLWFKEFPDTPVFYSLMYSKSYDKVFFSLIGDFTLVTLNSTTGGLIESITIGGPMQHIQALSCSLSNDEISIFWNVYSQVGYPGILRYDNQSISVNASFYELADESIWKDLIAISSEEVYFQIKNTYEYKFIKGSFNVATSRFEESYFVIMSGPTKEYGTAARMDDTSETVWQVVANSDIAYFQLNITDFSLIGSKYATGSTIASPEIIDMSITGEYVFVLFIANQEGLLMNINSTSKNVLWIVNNDVDTLLLSLFALDNHINIVESQLYNTVRYPMHNEIDPSLEINLYPTFNLNETSAFHFSETNDTKFDLTYNSPINKSISHYTIF